jgi:plasmid stability protein
MATLHIRNVPETLYQRLQNLAAQERRSLNAQVITLLSRSVEEGSSKSSVTELLQRAMRP